MALDTVKGNLLFGWYDRRKELTFKSIEYMAAIIPSKTLDKLVNAIPLSNPLFVIPDQDDALPLAMPAKTRAAAQVTAKKKVQAQNQFKKKLKTKEALNPKH